MFDSPDFDLAPYAELDRRPLVRRTFCSWEDAGWRSLLVQCFDHVPEAEHVRLPGVPDLHLVLHLAGDVVMRTRSGGRPVRRVPGTLELMVPGQESVRDYRATPGMRTVQVHIPSATVARAAARLGGPAPDFARLSAAVAQGDPVVEHLVRALPSAAGADDVYAESAAEFLTTHLLTLGRHERLPGPESAAVRAGIAVMRERLGEPLTLADIAAEVHLSVYHFVRVFRGATGETPHRYLTRLRIERARELLTGTDLTIGQIARRCGFVSPGALSTAFLGQVGVRPSVYRKN
ncbi:AraC family transcriptional regulator [Amycolatopsis bartoniae]|uniref:AraC family transcriptional regulator n=1 Tax=Amycolatopsis bartoniae TaxID=941986 RepID=A0A8H9IY56_9PSEU|nr:AraC family transcriptional regulator [Amycolatopsis bartoniae]MBB2938621.1 AraC family transcriptional regulator [Amycolatopsis bartoniae]TVT08881.1 helix-turn-helix domain-containing protein [Amycolatopsis bartoniae]GHF69685.1 AraC family transcriptional regulator [Amycolatopsis bartoniae]